jgi:hypothetical protein
VDKRSASTNTGIVMVDALRLSTLQQLLLTLNLMTVRLYLHSGYWQVAQVVSYAFHSGLLNSYNKDDRLFSPGSKNPD